MISAACIEFVSKNTFVSQDCFSINWLVKGWSFGVKFLNVSSRGGLGIFGFADLANFGVLHCLRVFSNFVFGFRFSSTMRAVFRIVLSNAFYGFSDFAKELTPRSLAKTGVIPRDNKYSVLPFL